MKEYFLFLGLKINNKIILSFILWKLILDSCYLFAAVLCPAPPVLLCPAINGEIHLSEPSQFYWEKTGCGKQTQQKCK